VANQQAAQQAALQAALAQRANVSGYKKGGVVGDEIEGPRAKNRPDRQWGNVGKAAEDLPPMVEKKAKGGKVKKRAPFGKGVPSKKTPPVPMVTDDDMGTPPPAMAAVPPGPPVGPPPVGPAPVGMAEGGECKKMAEGGVAKLRRGYPNTKGTAKVKKMAAGGSVRGCGAAKKGKGFSGIY
jgi:hypothetical protein